jgi:hypothetical protein
MVLFVPYALLHQWTFRCQRVSRGILLLAKDTAAGVPELHTRTMPDRMAALMAVKWLLWIGCGVFVWRAWHWWGIIVYLVYGFFLFSYLDIISPWPSYSGLLGLHEARLRSGKAGFDSYVSLHPWIQHIKQEMANGVAFETTTTGAWLGRAAERGRRAAQRVERNESPEPNSDA